MGRLFKLFDDPELVLLATMVFVFALLAILSRKLFGADDSVAMGILSIATLLSGAFSAAIRQAMKIENGSHGPDTGTQEKT